MSTHIHLPEEPTYYIVLNGSTVVTYGLLQPNNCFDTPYDNVETFLSEADYTARLEALGIDLTPGFDGPPLPDLP